MQNIAIGSNRTILYIHPTCANTMANTVPVIIRVWHEKTIWGTCKGSSNPDEIKPGKKIPLNEFIWSHNGEKVQGSCNITKINPIIENGILTRIVADTDDLILGS